MTGHHRTPEWARLRRRVRPIIAASLPRPCIDCGHPVHPEDRWQVGHVVAVSQGGSDDLSNLGPSHAKGSGPRGRACNQIAGGRMGAAIQGKARAVTRETERRLPKW